MKLLIVGFADSLHTINWLNSIDQKKHDVHFFPSRPYDKVPLNFPSVTYHSDAFQIQDIENLDFKNHRSVNGIVGKIRSTNKIFKKIFRGLIKLFKLHRSHKENFNTVLKSIKPDVLHLMETQHSGYLYLDIERIYGIKKVILSIWGIDLHYFGELPDHREKIIKLLKKINLLVVEGKRDIKLAKALGYNEDTIIIQATGGIDYNIINKVSTNIMPVEDRSAICLKGTQHMVRRGLFALAAIKKIHNHLKNTDIYIYSATEDVINEANYLSNKFDLSIKIVRDIKQNELIELFGKCRLNLIVNRSDGMSNSMLESMSVGCFPIISNTSCADDIIEDGKNGYIVEYDNITQIADRLVTVLSNDILVIQASEYNRQLIKGVYDKKIMSQRIESIYQ